VAEADESDGSFLRLDPEVAVVTNVEMDHHSKWGSLEPLVEAFAGFAGKSRAAILPAPTRDGGAVDELRAQLDSATEFSLGAPGPAELDLAVPGAHNVQNARAALAALGAAGFDLDAAAKALGDFRGVRRRLEVKGERGGVRIYDDYAHHPTEVRAALSALRELEPARLVAVFQPHLFSRTKVFARQFGAALALADEIAVLDVYPAREEPIGPLAGVSGLDVARAAADSAHGRPVAWTPTAPRAEAFLSRRLETLPQGSILVTIGAGDVFRIGESLVTGGEGDPERTSPQFVSEGSPSPPAPKGPAGDPQ
jgi:UDP-N-acetylmuramate--alanine ligase